MGKTTRGESRCYAQLDFCTACCLSHVRLYLFNYFNYLKDNAIEIRVNQMALLLYARRVLRISLDSHMTLGV